MVWLTSRTFRVQARDEAAKQVEALRQQLVEAANERDSDRTLTKRCVCLEAIAIESHTA